MRAKRGCGRGARRSRRRTTRRCGCHADAADAAALEHERQRAAAGRAREDAIQAANQEFVRAIMQAPAAVAIERDYARARQEIEQRAEAEKQEIYRLCAAGSASTARDDAN